MRSCRLPAFLAALVVLSLVLWLPTRHLPWTLIDSPIWHEATERLRALPPARALAASCDLGELAGEEYRGRFQPVLWLSQAALVSVVGWDAAAHRVLRWLALLAIALWTFAMARRATESDGWAFAAGAGFLLAPALAEVRAGMPVVEPLQTCAMAALIEALWWWRRTGRTRWLAAAAVALTLALGLKETSFCLGLVLLVSHVWPDGGRRRGHVVLWAVYLAGLALFVASGGGRGREGSWTSNYATGAGALAGAVRERVDQHLRTTGLLLPLGALGLVVRGRRRGAEANEALALPLALSAGAWLVYLPFKFSFAHYDVPVLPGLAIAVAAGLQALAEAAPCAAPPPAALAVAAGGAGAWLIWDGTPRASWTFWWAAIAACLALAARGLARAPRAWAGALRAMLVGTSAVWLVAWSVDALHEAVALATARDGAIAGAVQTLAAAARPGQRVLHPCRPDPTQHHFAVWFAKHLHAFAGRPDLAVLTHPVAATSPPPEAEWVLLVANEPDVAAPAGTLLVETSGAVTRRAVPSPRYFAKCIAWHLTASGTGGPGAFPLREAGWRQVWGYRVYQSR